MSQRERITKRRGGGGGSPGAKGYNFQAEAGAYVVAHALSGTPLRWTEGAGTDVPVAVSAETGGAGDDWCIELEDGRRVEVQCKRGLDRGDDLWKALIRLARGLAEDAKLAGVLLVDGTSSGTIKNELREDLVRFGGGRRGDLKAITKDFLKLLEAEGLQEPESICERLRVVTLDLTVGADAEKLAVTLLQNAVLKDSTQAAWNALVTGCDELMGRRGSRHAQAWLDYLTREGIRLLPSAAPPPAPELTSYLGRVMREAGKLVLDPIDPKKRDDPQGQEDLALDAVYTALLTHSVEREELEGKAQARELGREPRKLSALEQANRSPRLVLLGDPGSGKSTFVNFVALCLARECLERSGAGMEQLTAPLPGEKHDGGTAARQPWRHGALVPVRVVLREFAARGLPDVGKKATAEDLWRFIESQPECVEPGSAAALRAWLREQGGLMLLDGLDEVPEGDKRREQIQQVVEDFAAIHPRCRVLVTSRTYAYLRQGWRLRRFEEAELAPFTAAQINHFVDRWYASVTKARGQHEDEGRGRARELKEAIERSGDLASLAKQPLLLTLMASLHAWHKGDLPRRRGRLYAETVDLLLERWQGQKLVRVGETKLGPRSVLEWLRVDKDSVRRLLEELAFDVHAAQPTLTGTADIAEEVLVRRLVGLKPKDVDERLLVEFLRERAGLLHPRGVGVYTFVHRTFQEYLAACHLTSSDVDVDQLVELLKGEPDRWREVTLLAAAKLSDGTGLVSLLEGLCANEPDAPEVGAPEAWAAHVAGLALWEMPDVGRLFVAKGRIAKTVKRVRGWMVRNMKGTLLPPRERALAGLALDRVGDVRFGNNPWGLPDEKLMGFVRIPAGPFLMGSAESDSQADDDEKPQHELTLPDYYIGQYPVTVGQFRAYCEAAKVGPEDEDALRGASNLPVAWVSWEEARKYCEWLTKEMLTWEGTPEELRKVLLGEGGRKWQVALPSEAEWEKAARWTDGRKYPWGSEWDVERANCGGTEMWERSPVGCFHAGRSHYGVEEMSGNVWEWTRSLWNEYPYPADERGRSVRESLAEEGHRVVRGGSFHSGPWLVRCAFRRLMRPGHRSDDIGFRVVLSPLL